MPITVRSTYNTEKSARARSAVERLLTSVKYAIMGARCSESLSPYYKCNKLATCTGGRVTSGVARGYLRQSSSPCVACYVTYESQFIERNERSERVLRLLCNVGTTGVPSVDRGHCGQLRLGRGLLGGV